MSVHRKISQFIPSQETWSSYTERLEYYFIANDVQDPAKKKAILLTVCGPSTFQLLKNLLQPNTPESKSYTDLVDLLKNHFNPTPSVIMQRFKFNTRTRKDTESVVTYVAELKRLDEHCEFGDKLNETVRDRLVCGVNDIRIQNRLLQESKLTYDKAFELAQSVEVAAKNAADLLKGSSTHNTTVVQHLHSKSPSSTTFRRHVSCYRCGGNHLANVCSFQTAECRACGKIGHIAKVCRNKNRQPPRHPHGRTFKPQDRPVRSSKKANVHTLTTDRAPFISLKPLTLLPLQMGWNTLTPYMYLLCLGKSNSCYYS